MASVALGLGLGTEGLTKREVAGPVPFRMSETWSVRAEGRDTPKEGRRADCSHFLPITLVLERRNLRVNPINSAERVDIKENQMTGKRTIQLNINGARNRVTLYVSTAHWGMT